MDVFHIVDQQPPVPWTLAGGLPEKGYLWLDVERSAAAGWVAAVESIVGCEVDPQHVEDSLNPAHPSFFDGTATYDMVVFQGLGPKDAPLPVETRSVTFFIFDRILVSVRAVDSVSPGRARQRLLEARIKAPASPFRLAQLVLDMMIDRFLAIREPLDDALSDLQDSLLDPAETMDDWRALLDARRQMRLLQRLSDGQQDVMDAWRRNSRFEWKQSDEVRFRDMYGHIDRVMNHAGSLERDLESAIQLHFAAVAHRTNQVMQTLTVLSAIFFPLTLIVGLYGMNFDNIPELHWRYGYFVVLGLLGGIALSLWIYFKRRRLI